VLRQGRVSNAQRRAVDTLSSVYGLAYAPGALDFEQVFGRRAPTILEIGFGMGETTALIAQAHPENNHLGIEVHTPGVGSLLKQIAELGLGNLRLIQHDAVEVLEHMVAPATLAGAHIFFPDPWPKKRHHKRRLVQPSFAALAARKLAAGGYFHAATDWPAYAEQMDAVLSAEPLLEKADQVRRRPVTKFERRGIGLGHAVRDLLFLRRKE
jgi:tRNA (guanine-N7-)-methyltransferase